MRKQVIIELTKATLVLSEGDIWNGLRQDILVKGLKQGKAYLRCMQSQQREEQRHALLACLST